MTGVRFPAGAVIFVFVTASRPSLGPTQPPIQWVSGGSFSVGKVVLPHTEQCTARNKHSTIVIIEFTQLFYHTELGRRIGRRVINTKCTKCIAYKRNSRRRPLNALYFVWSPSNQQADRKEVTGQTDGFYKQNDQPSQG
jgi:hypothetical protein